MNIISIFIGLVSGVLMLVGLIPLLGWLNWLVLVFTFFGVVFGALAKNKAGLIINVVVIVIAGIRLTLGGGIF